MHLTRFHPDYGLRRHLIMSFSQTHGGFTEATARSATAQKWCSPKRSAGTLPATMFPLSLLSIVLVTVFIIAIKLCINYIIKRCICQAKITLLLQ